MDNQTTIGRLFGEDMISFIIPSYQRAYSWRVGKDGRIGQVEMYLNDIIDQPDCSNYFLGHYLFEKTPRNRYELIDGQQRLTTTVIFMSCLVKELRKRGIERFEYNNIQYATEQIYERYLQPRYGNQKFETLPEDSSFFNRVIIKCDGDYNKIETGRKSEQRIREAILFFEKKMSATTKDETLYKWFYVIDNAIITTFVLSGESAKLTATQIFAFQNDRGLGLTTLEKLKAFLMHQIYRNNTTNAISNIHSIEAKFASIYTYVERLETKEDTVLGYHCSAFLSSYDSPLEAIKESLLCTHDKTKWINDFTSELCRTYSLMCEIENTWHLFNSLISDVCILDKADSMPLVLKLCHYNSNGTNIKNNPAIDNALKLVEKILFKMTYTLGDYRTNNLISIAKNYKPDGYENLLSELTDKCIHGFQQYWDFNGNCLRYFTVNKYHYYRELRYLLYKYENYLRVKACQPLLSPDECTNVFRDVSVSNTLDHITPQTPDFTEYSEEFYNDYLNNIGNLSLLTWGNNASKKNHNPADNNVMEMYNSIFYSHKEIYETLKREKQWGETQIEERRDKIVRFIKENWLN
ncbi:DUF262 domain-containing protein [Bacteroides faecis]|uniref:DUF262 domain-containing protein n=1 Tax=Bacteroides faecis TaxID=674529 RepID=UPI0034A32455